MLKRFSSTEACPKCGGRAHEVEFSDRGSINDEEVMRVTCRDCGYKFDRAPMDAKENVA